MDSLSGANKFRETIRILERKLGILDDIQKACCGVTFAQCHAIIEIGRAHTLSLNDLAEVLELDKSTMSRTINNLVNDGLAVRELDNEDRRFVRIGLTTDGRKAYEGIEEAMKLYFQNVYGSIPEEKRAQVIESLDLLVKALIANECCENCREDD